MRSLRGMADKRQPSATMSTKFKWVTLGRKYAKGALLAEMGYAGFADAEEHLQEALAEHLLDVTKNPF
jgi:hypothetical protein